MDSIGKNTDFDFTLFFTAVTLWVIGIFLVYSATHLHETGPLVGLAKTQVVWVIMGICILLVVTSIPFRFFHLFSWVFYGLSLMLIAFIIVKGGHVAKGGERWLAIAGFKIQPSEFAKIGVLLALARYLADKELSLSRFTSLIVPALVIGVPFILVLKQPDLGTAMVFCAMSLPMFFWAGLSILELFFLVSPVISLVLSAIPLFLAFGQESSVGILDAVPWGIFFLILVGLFYLNRLPIVVMSTVIILNLFTAGATTVVWNTALKDYQKMRIISFINPQMDPFGAGYQVIQSKVAIGSGGVFGKGYLKGTQTKLSYLPEQHTDFIFSVLGEQFGLLGCYVVIGLFLLLVIRGYYITHFVKNRFTNLVVVGSVSIIVFHIFLNIAMTLGIMPVAGIPLPFLSYGGSFVLTISILMGFMLNARMSRHQDF